MMKFKLPRPDHVCGYTGSALKQVFTQKTWDAFVAWEPTPLGTEGEEVIFGISDVMAFLDLKPSE